jgi:hypothetical protein
MTKNWKSRVKAPSSGKESNDAAEIERVAAMMKTIATNLNFLARRNAGWHAVLNGLLEVVVADGRHWARLAPQILEAAFKNIDKTAFDEAMRADVKSHAAAIVADHQNAMLAEAAAISEKVN